MLSSEPQLIQIAKLVEQWQQSKQYRNSPVPIGLRQQITALFEHFSYNKVKNNLNMSESLLYRWWKEYKNEGNQLPSKIPLPSQKTAFIELPPAFDEQKNEVSLEVDLNNMCKIRLTGNISTQQLDIFTRNIFMYQRGDLS